METDTINHILTVIGVTGLCFMVMVLAFAVYIGIGVLWKHGTEPYQHDPNDRRHGCDSDQVFWW